MKDIVSVITTFYNAQDYILKCLNSVNNQLINEFFEIEFVLVDDCSTDDTAKIIKIFFDNYTTGNVKSKVIKTPQNMGCGGARNFGIANSSISCWVFGVFILSKGVLSVVTIQISSP